MLVEVVRTDYALKPLDLGHLVADLLAARLVAAVGLDRVPDRGHEDVGRVIRLHGVAAEVVWSGELLLEVGDCLRCRGHLGRVGAG